MVGFQTRLRYAIQADIFRMIPGLGNARVRAPRRPPPQHVPEFAQAARRHAAPEGDAAAPLRRPDHRLRGLCRVGGDRPARRPLRRRRAAWRADRACRRPPRPSARSSATSPAAISRPTRAGQALVPADERQLRPVPADRRSSRDARRAHVGAGARQARSARDHRPRAGRSRRAGSARPAAEAAE